MTGFFHDRGLFAALGQMIPELFEGRMAGDGIRVWAPACGAGEQAYSLGMLFLEEAASRSGGPGVQVFGCDPDAANIETAREGVYAGAVARSAGKTRFRRFFAQHGQKFRVTAPLRKIVLFAVHDPRKDAAFARMDAIVCGHLLGQQDAAGQRRLLDQFRFALKDRGLLCVGGGVKLTDAMAGYETLDAANQVYRREPDRVIGSLRYASASALLQAVDAEERARTSDQQSLESRGKGAAKPEGRAAPSLPENALRHIERVAPASVVINGECVVLHLTHEMQELVEPGGDASGRFPSMLHRSLRARLRSALTRAMTNNRQVVVPRVAVRLKEETYEVQITIAPAPELGAGLFIVSFDRLASPGSVRAEPSGEPLIRALQSEIESLRGQLRESDSRFAAGKAELDCRNAELETANAQLRGAAEEWETGQQELQSMNKHLIVVNRELGETIKQLKRANGELENFLDATGIAAIFLDRDLNVVRYSPGATSLFRLIPTDVGRPLAQLRSDFKSDAILSDARAALTSRRPLQARVADGAGRNYVANIMPHQDAQGRQRGVALTFVELRG